MCNLDLQRSTAGSNGRPPIAVGSQRSWMVNCCIQRSTTSHPSFYLRANQPLVYLTTPTFFPIRLCHKSSFILSLALFHQHLFFNMPKNWFSSSSSKAPKDKVPTRKCQCTPPKDVVEYAGTFFISPEDVQKYESLITKGTYPTWLVAFEDFPSVSHVKELFNKQGLQEFYAPSCNWSKRWTNFMQTSPATTTMANSDLVSHSPLPPWLLESIFLLIKYL